MPNSLIWQTPVAAVKILPMSSQLPLCAKIQAGDGIHYDPVLHLTFSLSSRNVTQASHPAQRSTMPRKNLTPEIIEDSDGEVKETK